MDEYIPAADFVEKDTVNAVIEEGNEFYKWEQFVVSEEQAEGAVLDDGASTIIQPKDKPNKQADNEDADQCVDQPDDRPDY